MQSEHSQFPVFKLNEFDAELSKRTSAEDWKRIITFRDQPNFPKALPNYHALIGNFFAGKLTLNKAAIEAWRFEMLVYTLYLYDTRDPANPRSGLTLTNLEKICTIQNCASPGRVRAVIGIMWIGGFLKRIRSNRDSRIVHFEPTAKFVDMVEGWNARILQILDVVAPGHDLAKCHMDHPRFGWEMRKRGAEDLLSGWKLLDPFPEVFHFTARDGGWMLLLHCAHEALRLGNGTHIAPVSLDLAAFGKRYGVSRSHLRRVLVSAYEAELLTAEPRNGSHVVLASKTLASYLTCMASEFEFFHRHALATKAALGINSPSTSG